MSSAKDCSEPQAGAILDDLCENQLSSGRIELSNAEVERLAKVLDREFSPTPALRRALTRLANSKRRPPKLRWKNRRDEPSSE